jgi:hypothetical protein
MHRRILLGEYGVVGKNDIQPSRLPARGRGD